MNYKIYTSEFNFTPFSNQVSSTEPRTPIDWGEFGEAGFSKDVNMEQDCETV